MNTLILLCGAGIGALIATILFLFVLKAWTKNRKVEDKIIDFNEANLATLKERNEIGRRQAKALETLAEWANENWKR